MTIFFLISGFLLYRPFIAHRGSGAPAPAVRDYAKRRLLRILPAYWLVLTALALIPGLSGIHDGDWAAQYALVHALPIAGDSGCSTAVAECGLAQTWSLVVELTFYALLPLYVLATARLAPDRGIKRWMWLELGLLALLSTASVIFAFGLSDNQPMSWGGGSVAGYFLWFALGMALAVVSVAIEGGLRPPAAIVLAARRPGLLWLGAAAAYLAVCAALPATPFLLSTSDQLAAHVSFGLIALLLLAPAVFADAPASLPGRFLLNPIVAWLGLISYGIFLWHYAFALEFGFPGEGWGFAGVLAATLAATVPCAAASYYAVERPLLRLKYRRVAGLRAGAPPRRRLRRAA